MKYQSEINKNIKNGGAVARAGAVGAWGPAGRGWLGLAVGARDPLLVLISFFIFLLISDRYFIKNA